MGYHQIVMLVRGFVQYIENGRHHRRIIEGRKRYNKTRPTPGRMNDHKMKTRAERRRTAKKSVQSLLEHPLHPQLTHCIACSSLSCALGTRQIHVELKLVSFV